MWKKVVIVIGIFLLGIARSSGALWFGNIKPDLKEAVVLATTVKPEPFTELYFENHLKLPYTIIQQKEYSFIFTIHNLEYQDMDYSYIVSLTTNEDKIILDESVVHLKQDEYRSIRENFGPLMSTRMKITVELVNKKNQSIAFWME